MRWSCSVKIKPELYRGRACPMSVLFPSSLLVQSIFECLLPPSFMINQSISALLKVHRNWTAGVSKGSLARQLTAREELSTCFPFQRSFYLWSVPTHCSVHVSFSYMVMNYINAWQKTGNFELPKPWLPARELVLNTNLI